MSKITRLRHTFNGRFYGMWYFWDDGRSLYLAHRRPGEIYHKKNAWCLDVRTLEEAEKRGVKFVGVVSGSGKNKRFYVTLREDFFDSAYSFAHFGETRQRGLPLARFRYSTTASVAHITKAIKLR